MSVESTHMDAHVCMAEAADAHNRDPDNCYGRTGIMDAICAGVKNHKLILCSCAASINVDLTYVTCSALSVPPPLR